MSAVVDALSGHAALLLGVLAIAEGILAGWLVRRNDELVLQLRRSRDAAEQAARAAALAAPGEIDPELVIHLLRSGQVVTLEAVRELMAQRSRADVASR